MDVQFKTSTVIVNKLNLAAFETHSFTCGHSPPEWALRLISSTVFFLES